MDEHSYLHIACLEIGFLGRLRLQEVCIDSASLASLNSACGSSPGLRYLIFPSVIADNRNPLNHLGSIRVNS